MDDRLTNISNIVVKRSIVLNNFPIIDMHKDCLTTKHIQTYIQRNKQTYIVRFNTFNENTQHTYYMLE